jgi:hypothetical protein
MGRMTARAGRGSVLEVGVRKAVSGCLIAALLAPACAAPGARGRSPAPAVEASDPDCEAFAQKARAQVEGGSVGLGALQGAARVVGPDESARSSATQRSRSAAETAHVVGSHYAGSPTSTDSLIGLSIYGGMVALGALVGALTAVAGNDDVQEAAHADALAACLRPALLTGELGPEHPEVARSLHALGYRYYRQGEFGKAEPLYLRALAIQEASRGANAPELATTLADYAALLKQTGRSRQAWDLERRAEEIHRANP